MILLICFQVANMKKEIQIQTETEQSNIAKNEKTDVAKTKQLLEENLAINNAFKDVSQMQNELAFILSENLKQIKLIKEFSKLQYSDEPLT